MLEFELQCGPLRIAFTLSPSAVATDEPEPTETLAYSTHERAPMGFSAAYERPDFA